MIHYSNPRFCCKPVTTGVQYLAEGFESEFKGFKIGVRTQKKQVF